MKPLAKIAAVCLLLYAAIQVGCWRSVVESRSPDGQHTARIKEWCQFPDCAIKAELASLPWPVNLEQTGDAYLGFGHIAWSTDSSVVAILVVNPIDGGIEGAWDVRSRRRLGAQVARRLLAASVAREYGLSGEQLQPYKDAVVWAWEDPQASVRFEERHP